ncbi:MAG: hypothetical protein HY791_36030 [Deltaproteobacteria bacterium]|nr:hypothetical protein [Deltaproteobacteria bacterium]
MTKLTRARVWNVGVGIVTLLSASASRADELIELDLDGTATTSAVWESSETGMEQFSEQSIREFEVLQDLRYHLNFFGDFHAFNDFARGLEPSFELGGFGILMTGQLSGGLTAVGEIVFELGHSPTFIEVERFEIDYEGDGFELRAGRGHTRIGYWNGVFHHGVWLQPTIERPKIIRFEDDGGLIPVHWVGIDGGLFVLDVQGGRVSISSGVALGRGDTVEDVRTADDTNPEKSVSVSMRADDVGLRGLHAGAGAIFDWIAPADASVRPALPDESIREIVLNAFLSYRAGAVTSIAEVYGVHHATRGRSWAVFDAFVVFAIERDPIGGYGSFELLHRSGADPFFEPGGDGSVDGSRLGLLSTLGLRLATSSWSALKAEYGLELERTGEVPSHSVRLHWSFGL